MAYAKNTIHGMFDSKKIYANANDEIIVELVREDDLCLCLNVKTNDKFYTHKKNLSDTKVHSAQIEGVSLEALAQHQNAKTKKGKSNKKQTLTQTSLFDADK